MAEPCYPRLQTATVAALDAVADFNKRSGRYAPLLGGEELRDCDKLIEASIVDSSSIGGVTVERYVTFPKPDAMIGPARSVASVAVAPIA